MDKISNLQWTKDHDQFKIIDYNRQRDPRKIEILAEEIKRRGFLVPILVNEDLYVVDGQHRLDAARLIGASISYIVIDVSEENMPFVIAALNATSHTWKLVDYFNMWEILKKPVYLYLSEAMKKYHMSFTLLWELVKRGVFTNVALRAFKDGVFTLTDSQRSLLETRLRNFDDIVSSSKHFQDFPTAFLGSVAKLVAAKQYDHGTMMSALTEDAGSLLRARNGKDYLLQFESMYNRTAKRSRKIHLVRAA